MRPVREAGSPATRPAGVSSKPRKSSVINQALAATVYTTMLMPCFMLVNWVISIALLTVGASTVIAGVGIPIMFVWAYHAVAVTHIDAVLWSSLFPDIDGDIRGRMYFPRLMNRSMSQLTRQLIDWPLVRSSFYVLVVQSTIDLTGFITAVTLLAVSLGMSLWWLVRLHCDICRDTYGSGATVDRTWRAWYNGSTGIVIICVGGVICLPLSLVFIYRWARMRAYMAAVAAGAPVPRRSFWRWLIPAAVVSKARTGASARAQRRASDPALPLDVVARHDSDDSPPPAYHAL